MARPTEYDREEVLDQAMHAFWDKGYNATSMSELVEVTNLKPGSLYGAFSSKEELFLVVLDHYGQNSRESIQATLTGSKSPLDGIRNCFVKIAKEISSPGGRHSCFLVNTVLELSRQNKNIQERVNLHLTATESLFREALEAAQDAGEISSEKNPKILASFLMCGVWGLRVLGETAPSPKRSRDVVNQMLSILN